ncbi:hypothetical protein FRX31_022302 [Thalictrum thalictroides]|uniref:Uncharacterized protein n=1 Tax=Thalictrum thalictroides TaxID=46969 RepID=A0A7J6VTL0_THATH|nr:hypothetical protein FRX31_022302 [Thalictrum thalictroides]
MEDSMWVRWSWDHNIKHKQIWSMKVPSECSWMWRNILYTRDIARKKIKYSITNGDKTSLWHDPWCQGQLLCENEEARNLFLAPPEAKVSMLITNGEWNQLVTGLPECSLKTDMLIED